MFRKKLKIKNCFCEKRLIGKLVLECEDEILNTNETILNDNKVAYAKKDCSLHTTSLVIICLLLLVVICVSCCFYYTKYRSKEPFYNINIELGKIRY